MDYRAALNRVMPPTVRPRREAMSASAAVATRENAGDSPLQPIAPPGPGPTVRADRAIFTSIRTPMGEGYRIVAAGAGITPAEKAEITARSPSHGALLGQSEFAWGLLAYPLASGRVCVSASRYGGREHTGRGGERVWTDVVVLDGAAYRALGCNPIRAHGALVAAVPSPQTKPLGVLKPLELRVWDGLDAPRGSIAPLEMDPFARIVGTLLSGRSWVIAGAVPSLGMLENALDMIPVSRRAEVSVSVGLGFCLTRRSNLVFVGGARPEARRVIAGQDIGWCDFDAEAVPRATPYDDWLTLVQTHAADGRLSSLARLTARLSESLDTEGLRRLADLVSAGETACRADDEERAALRERYALFEARGAQEAELLQRLRAELAPVAEVIAASEADASDTSGVRTPVEDCQLRVGS